MPFSEPHGSLCNSCLSTWSPGLLVLYFLSLTRLQALLIVTIISSQGLNTMPWHIVGMQSFFAGLIIKKCPLHWGYYCVSQKLVPESVVRRRPSQAGGSRCPLSWLLTAKACSAEARGPGGTEV